MRPVLLSLGVLLTTWSIALANGGPVEWAKGVGRGGVSPREETSIRLESEKLKLTVLDYDHYRVEAEYVLQSENDDKSVTFGVPLTIVDEKAKALLEQSIRIKLNDKVVSCRMVEADHVVPDTDTDDYVDESERVPVNETHWCVAQLLFPKGESKLSLSYDSELDFTDWIFTKSALKEYHDRFLNYLLSPAGYWKGPVKQVSIRLDPGPYGPKRVNLITSSGFSLRDGIFVFDEENVDFKIVDRIKVLFDVDPLLRQRDLIAWNRVAPEYARISITAQASSTLKPSKVSTYDAANLLDSDASTAWCEGKDGPGVGEWIELQIAPKTDLAHYCNVEGVAIVPAYAKSRATWAENGGVAKIELSQCGQSDSEMHEIAPEYPYNQTHKLSFDLKAALIRLDYEGFGKNFLAPVRQGESACLRLKILDVRKGSKFEDTCISELAIVVNCG